MMMWSTPPKTSPTRRKSRLKSLSATREKEKRKKTAFYFSRQQKHISRSICSAVHLFSRTIRRALCSQMTGGVWIGLLFVLLLLHPVRSSSPSTSFSSVRFPFRCFVPSTFLFLCLKKTDSEKTKSLNVSITPRAFNERRTCVTSLKIEHQVTPFPHFWPRKMEGEDYFYFYIFRFKKKAKKRHVNFLSNSIHIINPSNTQQHLHFYLLETTSSHKYTSLSGERRRCRTSRRIY